ncbi:MAG: PPOX class F420-dependent oxidoreductase [Actinomycetes bacterium]
MSRRDQIELTPDEQRAYLASQRTVVLASVGPDGAPHVVPMWFCLRDGVVHTWTYATSQKARNLARDPRATLLVEDGETYEVLRGVMVRAEAELLDDPDDVFDVGWEIAVRYAGGEVPTDPDVRAGMEGFVRAQAAKRVAHRFVPVETSSWDHRKLGGGY